MSIPSTRQGSGSKGFFSCLGSNEVHSFTRKMHRRVKKERRARRIANGKNVDPEDAEPEGEMDNFQELQLGSLSPVVRCEGNSLWPSIG